MDFRRALHLVPGLAPDDRSTRKQMHRMGHGSMRAALAYQAVVGWIDMTPGRGPGPADGGSCAYWATLRSPDSWQDWTGSQKHIKSCPVSSESWR